MDPSDFELDNPFKPPVADLSAPKSSQGGDDPAGTTSPVDGYPLLTMWIFPRATIRHILNTKSFVSPYLLAALSGIAFLMFQLVDEENEYSDAEIIGSSIIFGPIVGIACMYINGFAMKWAGRVVGGKAKSKECRTAGSWAALPEILLGAILFSLWALGTIGGIGVVTNTSIMMVADISAFLFILWQSILTVRSLAEVHRIGSWRMLGAILFGWSVFLLILAVVAGIVLSIFGFVFLDAVQ